MTNTPVDWKVFEYKFSQEPSKAFESLANILFCYELERPYGVFRYFNQPYIETEPVTAADGSVTGFQAKYYDASTSLSSKEKDLKAAIEGAKDKYTGINRILFYINKEMSASSHKNTDKPTYQKNIEKCGEALGIAIEWRVPGNIEQMLWELPNVRDLYFNPQPGLVRYMELIRGRGNSILANIQSEIPYQGQTIKIQHDTQALHTFLDSDKDACVVYGDAGTGKSGVVKDLIRERQARDDTLNFFMFAATDLDVEEEALFLSKYGDYQIEDVFALYGQGELKVCVIESAEKFSTLNKPQVFESLIRKFIERGWKMIFTIRTAYKNGFCSLLLGDVSYDELWIDRISEELLVGFGKQYGFQLPEDKNLRNLLCDLFYLKLYLKLAPSSLNIVSSAELFMAQIWKEVICNDTHRVRNFPVRRDQMATNIVFSMLQHETSVYRSEANDDYEALQALEESGVISVYDNSTSFWMMSHDVYEELIVKHILTDRYQRRIPAEDFLEGFRSSLRARKLYRIWLEVLLSQDGKQPADFFISVMQSHWDQAWKLYLGGEGVLKDVDEAIRWLNLSADKKNQFAEYALGTLYHKGESAPKDITKAIDFLSRAAAQENEFAQYRLGKIYLTGEDTPKDIEKALRYLTASAERGNQFAQYTLGKLYLMGKDVPKDKETATKWFTLAAAQGNIYAQFFLDHMDNFKEPSVMLAATRLLHHMSRIIGETEPARMPPNPLVDTKLRQKIKAKKMAQGHAKDDHEQTMSL